MSAEFSADGSKIVTGSFDGTAKIWDATTAAEIARITGRSDIVVSAVFSPGDARVVTASFDGTAEIWDISTG